MPRKNWQDSRWTEISASLRDETLYVKIPREKVNLLIWALLAAHQDLFLKEVLESEKTFVFSGSPGDWNGDLLTLKSLKTSDDVVTELIQAVKAGLRNEAQVDWITRIGGPPRS